MKRTSVNKILDDGNTYKVQGHIESIRDTRNMIFIILKDISGKIQITVDKKNQSEIAENILKNLSLHSFITVIGKVIENKYVKLNGLELIPDKLIIDSIAEPLPIQEDAAIDLRLDYRWIDLRKERNQLIFKVQTYMLQIMRDFLLNKNFLEIHTPKLIGAASESGADVFQLDYFDKKAYLTQSPQFYKQMAMASGFEKIFEIGPVFRAEKSYTSKHATEFTGFDLEFSYIESYRDIMDLEEDLIIEMLQKIQERFGEEIQKLFNIKVIVPSKPFPVITLELLYSKLEEMYGYTILDEDKVDLTTEAEKLSYRYAREIYGHEFIFITDFNKSKRAFYHMRKNGIPQGYDLIWRGTEITTGAQREHRYERLLKQAEEIGLKDDVKFYLEFFKYGCPPHGGFGIGVDRLTMLLLGINIKEAMFIFRGPNRITP